MHAAIPVSLDDLPPGFEGVAAKRASLDAESIAAMVPQISWQFPSKFVLNLSWQVVAGEESTEVAKQEQREVRVLEAVYPRASAIPPSPSEAQEMPEEIDETLIPIIPLVPVEDDEEGMEEDSLQTVAMSGIAPLSDGLDSEGTDVSPTQAPSPQDSHRVCSGTTVIAKDSTGLDASFIKDADLNVAAAAAAAYAAVKATESGRMIDHDLLVKILNNPLLIETLAAASQKCKNVTAEATTNPKRLGFNNENVNTNNEQFGGFSVSQSMPSSQVMLLPALNEAQKLSFTPEGKPLQGVHSPPGSLAFNGANGGVSSAQEGALTQSTCEQSACMAGAISQNGSFSINSQPYCQPASGPHLLWPQAAAAGSGRALPPRQDYLKELIQQHGVVRVNNEAQARLGLTNSAPLDDCNRNLNVERTRSMGIGPKLEPSNKWLQVPEHLHSGSIPARAPRDDSVHDRLGAPNIEGRIRPWKQCIYFNTPRGCRNGPNCNFLHEASAEKRPERTRVDASHPQQVKRPKVESGAAEVK
eukprot:c28535_g1_i2 orf=1061-2644(+)